MDNSEKWMIICVKFLKKKWNHDPQLAIQKSKGADSQAQRIGENAFDLKVLIP